MISGLLSLQLSLKQGLSFKIERRWLVKRNDSAITSLFLDFNCPSSFINEMVQFSKRLMMKNIFTHGTCGAFCRTDRSKNEKVMHRDIVISPLIYRTFILSSLKISLFFNIYLISKMYLLIICRSGLCIFSSVSLISLLNFIDLTSASVDAILCVYINI